jgi:tetratricopeptide (TPR) repeat protein
MWSEPRPLHADVQGSYGYFLIKFMGRPDLALPHIQKAVELDPMVGFWIFTLGRVYDGMERTEEALAMYGRARNIEPNSAIGYAGVSGLVLANGQVAESLNWNHQAMERDPLDVELKANHAFTLMTLGDLDEAEFWLQQAEAESSDDQPLPMAARAIWNSMSGKPEAASELARFVVTAELPDRWGSDAIVLRALRNDALSKGNVADALVAFQKRHPGLFTAIPEVTIQNILQAVDLSSLWINSGKTQQAETLLQAVITAYDQPYFATGSYVSWIVPAKAQALTLLGRQEEAIAELQRIVDGGWRISWQWETELNPNFDSLRADPRYLAIIDFLRNDMETQRQEYLSWQQAEGSSMILENL